MFASIEVFKVQGKFTSNSVWPLIIFFFFLDGSDTKVLTFSEVHSTHGYFITLLEFSIDVVLTLERINELWIWSASVVLKLTHSMFNVWAHSCTFVPKKIWQASLLRIMSVDVQLFNSTQALKEHWNWQRKRGLYSPELLCSALPVNAPQWASLQKTKAYQGRLRGCVREKTQIKTASKASIGEQWQKNPTWWIHFWQKRQVKKSTEGRGWVGRSYSEGLVREWMLDNQSHRQKKKKK